MWILTALAFALSAALIVSGATKLLGRRQFQRTVASYSKFPAKLRVPIATSSSEMTLRSRQ